MRCGLTGPAGTESCILTGLPATLSATSPVIHSFDTIGFFYCRGRYSVKGSAFMPKSLGFCVIVPMARNLSAKSNSVSVIFPFF